ncbi:LysR family transcriptional regulator [uncultured delta proteobacterium]|uniref:LysR family transcriptional regulator n=1 Tax=uncultured delta proteobacterium TaxID=34034 RepID=A0A212JAS6_9DELT|nr:LysR family transcriptional regulator [uncultured delta proteobacterium]
MNITLKQLQVFVAVARHQNLSRASEALFMTKGAVSQSLGELERRLGVALFDRAHPKLHLNHEGKRLLPMADELVHRAEDVERSFSGTANEGAEGNFLRVGCTQTIGNDVLPELLAGFSATAGWLPEVTIANTAEILRMLASFTLDAALLEGEERLPEIVFEPWIEDEMVVIAPPGHRLAQGHRVHPARELAKERWIVREVDSGSREYFNHTLGPLVEPMTIALTLSSPATIVRSVSQGLGLAFVSRLSASRAKSGSVAVIALKERFSRTFSICYHSRKYHSAAMRAFLSFCREDFSSRER